MQNVAQIINTHNITILNMNNKTKDETKACNCKKKYVCPLKSSKKSCRAKNVVYEATVKSENEIKTYIGLTSQEFKARISQHRHDFKNIKKKDSTELSKHIWKLKEKKENFDLSWKIIKQVNETRNGSKMCRLCITEAAMIIRNKKDQLNTRQEIMNKCRHQNKFLLRNWKAKNKMTM